MPHIRIESFKEPALPFEEGGVKFEWYAKNLEHENEGLIGVETEGVPFLLQVKPKAESVLIKGEKITRPSPNTLLKKALQAYIDTQKPNVLQSNIANIERAKLTAPPEALKEIARFDASSIPDKPLWVEIGFGSGRHLVHQAKQNPDVHLIGLEIHRPSLEQVLRRIELDSIENLWVIDYDARLFMELLPSDRVERIFVHFPVPWDKKPHRRVISDAFLEESMRVLKPGGTLELRTDSENYFRYAMETFTRPERVKLSLMKNMEAAVRSKYEDRWRRLEKNIYEIHVEALESSKPRNASYDFSFDKPRSISALFAEKPEKAWRTEEFFVHVERFYAISEKEGLIRLSFGSFDRPEHKFVLIRNGIAVYYPHVPVRTETNYKAHQMIREWIACETS
ncbi:tRNA (guanosine(46)-N7)-methyltransferase TrmB [Hydrogenimonas sp.]